MFHVDAFTSQMFSGNPAAVCPLEAWLDDEVLQNIAAENNLSETAFLVKKEEGYDLRWFTPTVEVDLCGHATLASGFVIFSFLETSLSSVSFDTASGRLTVEKSGELLSMDFPARRPVPTTGSEILNQALGAEPKEVLKSRDLLAVFDDETEIREMAPDFEKLRRIRDAFAVIVTAQGTRADFVSRFFAPNAGVAEDPVTGSAHCTLIPFWAERLGKRKMRALQLSRRGGELFCEDQGERVSVGGQAVLYSRGELCM
jgi:PhzF family phenazine biosynthesis protein